MDAVKKDALDVSVLEEPPKSGLDVSVLEEPPKSGLTERHDEASADSAGESKDETPAALGASELPEDETPAALSASELPESPPTGEPDTATPEEERAAPDHAAVLEFASLEPPTEATTTSTMVVESMSNPPWTSPAVLNEPATRRRTLTPPWLSAPQSSGRNLPPPPSPWPASSSTRAVLSRASSAPPVATTIRREREKFRSARSASRGNEGPRKAIILGSALTIVFTVLYLGRDKLMGSPPSPATTAAATPTTATLKTRATLKASARQQGVTLVLDGKALGALPLTLQGLAPGEHVLMFEGSGLYAPQKSTVTLAPGETKELEPVSLAVTTGAAIFDVNMPGASLALVAADERRELADYSHPIEVDNSKSWLVEASKPGYKTVSLPIAFEDQAEKKFVVTLEKADEPSPKGAARGEATVAQSQPSSSRAEPAPTANCTLNIDSNPPSRLTLDGHSVGVTPKTGISVTPGTHSVMFVAERGKKATIVSCRSGEQKTMNVQLATH
jgi:hypothetical protein